MTILSHENIHGTIVYYIGIDNKIGYLYLKDGDVKNVFINKTKDSIQAQFDCLARHACEKITGSAFNYKLDEIKHYE